MIGSFKSRCLLGPKSFPTKSICFTRAARCSTVLCRRKAGNGTRCRCRRGKLSIPPVLVDSSSRRGGTHEVTLNGVRDRRVAPLRSRSWSAPAAGAERVTRRTTDLRSVKVDLPGSAFLVRFAEAAPIFAQRFRDALACSDACRAGTTLRLSHPPGGGICLQARFRGSTRR